MADKTIPFGLMLHGPGGHMNAWKHPKSLADASVNFPFYLDLAQKADRAGFSFLFVADGLYINEKSIPHFLNRFEPITILSALVTVTQQIGLVATVSTSYSDPYTIARQFASLDLISGGRVGWNVVTSPLEGSGRNYSRAHPDHDKRYEIADEYLNVVQGLWDSWEDDAFVRDREKGQFFDRSRLHKLEHAGQYFQVEGPLNIQRSPQGQPVIFQAGSSTDGIELAGKYADAVYARTLSIEENRLFRSKVHDQAKAHGRKPSDVKIFLGIAPIVGKTQDEIKEKLSVIQGLLDIDDALAYLGRFFDHHDFTQYDLDAPFPDLGDIGSDSFRATTDQIKQTAREQGQTLREAALASASPRTQFVGTPVEVADEIIRWIDSGAADGFNLGFPVTTEGFDDFVTLVLPELERRGRYSAQPSGETLRDHLGLPFRENRYTAARSDAKGFPA